MSTYVFDPAWAIEHDRLLAIESLFDEDSMRHLLGLGVGPGWQCLEVGCGAGGIARRLAKLVGDTGRVVGVDLDTRFVEGLELDNLEVRRQGLMAGAPEEGAFDLVHARAVLMHIPDHQRALERLVASVRPGGWVAIEDIDFGVPMAAALARYVHPAENASLVLRMHTAVGEVFAAAGADVAFGTRLIGGLRAAGVEGVGGALHTPLVAGGTENLLRGTVAYLKGRLAQMELVSAEEIERFLTLVADGSNTYTPPVMVTAWGRRPSA